MKKIISLALAATLAVSAFTGCSTEQLNAALVDGTYRAEFKDFDRFGWKDFVEVTVADGELSEVVYDSVNEDGTKLKSEDQSYKAEMESIVGTYPAKYNKDLINQFIESGKVTSVDIVAGATESTGKFKTLIMAAMKNANSGDTETEVVDNLVFEK